MHFVRKSVRAIGKLAIKIEPAAQDCIDALLELVATKVSYIVQEATVVIRNIFRKYPNRYESIISILCQHLDSLDEPEAKAAMIWVIGQYADRIDNSDVLLDDFLYSFADEPVEVQLALLTATVKLFIQRPTKGQDLVPKVLKWATEETDNPDLRDRGYMYWRLLSSDPATAKQVVMGEKPAITAESEKLDPATLEEMCLNVGTLATVYLKPVQQVFRSARVRKLVDSPALQKHTQPTYIAMEAHRSASADPPTNANGFSDPSSSSPSNSNNNNQQNQQSNIAAVADAADAYFSSQLGVGTQGLTALNIGDEMIPTNGRMGEERQYVVSQYHPQQVFQPHHMGNGNDDLLL